MLCVVEDLVLMVMLPAGPNALCFVEDGESVAMLEPSRCEQRGSISAAGPIFGHKSDTLEEVASCRLACFGSGDRMMARLAISYKPAASFSTTDQGDHWLALILMILIESLSSPGNSPPGYRSSPSESVVSTDHLEAPTRLSQHAHTTPQSTSDA